jgi:hypothetical protein
MFIYLLTSILLLSTSIIGSAAVPLAKRQATVCNGQAAFCNRSYSNITYMGAHDSFAFSEDPFALAADQHVNLTSQLNLGARLLQAQAHMNNGVIHFCHTSCALFDGGPVEQYLATVKSFLDANPNEVLTLLFTNPEGLSIQGVWEPAFNASGISDLAYVPPQLPMNISSWPTLGEMINSGKRVVVFLDAGADGTDGPPVPFILPEFQMIWETPFSVTNASFPCSVNRIDGPLPDVEHMYLINHTLNVNLLPFLASDPVIVSDPEEASTTNGITSIVTNANGCVAISGSGGRNPNFVLLDFVDLGQGLAAVNQLNGV